MKLSNILFAFLLILISLPCIAQCDTAALGKRLDASINSLSEKVNTVQTKTKTFEDSIALVTDSIKEFKNKLEEQLIIDSAALDRAQKNPKELLYKNFVFDKKNQKFGPLIIAFISFVLIILMWYYGYTLLVGSAMCRDESYDESGNLLQTDSSKEISPYSYSRVQLLWWTIVVLTCYIAFYGMTGTLIPLNPTVVILLGFGVLVCAGGKIIDKRQIQKNEPGERHQDKNKSIDFFTDILSDDSGVSIHRFQAVAFNIVFGISFISYFITQIYSYKYPFADFTDWQFGLIGISSSAYLVLKTTENNPGSKKEEPEVKPDTITQENRPGRISDDESNSGQHDR